MPSSTAGPSSAARPSASALRRARIDGTIHPLLPPRVFRRGAAVSDAFLATKRDRRTIRRSAFLSSIVAPSIGAYSDTVRKLSRRRRRPRRHDDAPAAAAAAPLSNLSSLASAIDDIDPSSLSSLAAAINEIDAPRRRDATRSLRRRERLARDGMLRFNSDLARISLSRGIHARIVADAASSSSSSSRLAALGAAAPGPPPTETAGRWASLRGQILSNMQRNPALAAPR